jgi:hypothetical protein
MPEQFENLDVAKLKNESISDAAATKRTQDLAKKAAEQRYDQDH